MLLLLLWRHLVSYADPDPSRPAVPPPINLRTSMRLLPAVDASTFRDDVGKRLVGALTRMSSLDLVRVFFFFMLRVGHLTKDMMIERRDHWAGLAVIPGVY